jgi:hypothetical protein
MVSWSDGAKHEQIETKSSTNNLSAYFFLFLDGLTLKLERVAAKYEKSSTEARHNS